MPKQVNKEEELCEKCAPRLGEILCPCMQTNEEIIDETCKDVTTIETSNTMVCKKLRWFVTILLSTSKSEY